MNVESVFQAYIVSNPDLVVCDIDSFDYEIVSQILGIGVRPSVFCVEYNPSFPVDEVLWVKFDQAYLSATNPRIYGASYKAWQQLFTQFGYKLVHVSGFCNLFWVQEEKGEIFSTPNILEEVTDTDEKVKQYIVSWCLPDFKPSWIDSPQLTKNQLESLKR